MTSNTASYAWAFVTIVQDWNLENRLTDDALA